MNPEIHDYKQQRHTRDRDVPLRGFDRPSPTVVMDAVIRYYTVVNVGNGEKQVNQRKQLKSQNLKHKKQ